MSDTSTNKSPKLETFLVDSDCDPSLVELFRRLGFRSRSILTVRIPNNDIAVLRWCIKYDYILVCHDKHKDTQTRYAFNSVMYHKRGRVIRVSGQPGQDALFALGKILVHRPEWQKHFAEESGQAVVHPGGYKFTNAKDLLERSTFKLRTPLPEDPKVPLRDRKPVAQRRRPRKIIAAEARRLPYTD